MAKKKAIEGTETLTEQTNAPEPENPQINTETAKGKVRVFTDPQSFKGTYNHKGFCFAAVHNSDDPSVRTGRVANMPQRQFMPTEKRDSSVMNDKLRELERILFRTFPGVRL